MQAVYVQEGVAIDYTPAVAVAAGTVVVQSGLLGIAVNDIEADRLGALVVAGVFDLVKITGAIAAGQEIFWDVLGDPVGGVVDSGAATTVPTNVRAGVAIEAAGEAATTVRVLLYQPALPSNSLSTLITDPGNAGAISVVRGGSVQLVTTGAQTRTLALPLYVGQMLALSMKTDGGDCVVTVAAAVNQTGNNTLTFNDAGDFLLLVGIESGANKRWRVVSNDGVTLSTV